MLRLAMVWAALGALVACGPAILPVPGKGGPAWIELTSEHFTLWTDTVPARAHELIREMEHFRQAVVGVAFPNAPATARAMVIAFRDDEELHKMLSDNTVLAYDVLPEAPWWQPVIILPAYSDYDPADTRSPHELTHLISHMVVRHQPRWLSEGIAEFFETLQIDPDKSTVIAGLAPRDGTRPSRMPSLVSASTLFAWQTQQAGKAERQLYGTAWALFTFLTNEHRAELVHYLELLAAMGDTTNDLTPKQLERAWDEAFPSLPVATLDTPLRQWLVRGSHMVFQFNIQLREGPVAEHTLTDADVYAMRAWLFWHDDQKRSQRANLLAALEADPTNVLARVISSQLGDTSLTAAVARTMVAAHADDWRAWWLASTAISAEHGNEAEAEAAAAKACALIAQNPAVLAPPKLCPAHVVDAHE